MKRVLMDDLNDEKSIPVYVSARHGRWAFLSDPTTDMPVLICIDSVRNANAAFMDVVDEVFKPTTVERIEASFNLEKGKLFDSETFGQMVLVYGVIAIRVDPDASIPVIAHECVHTSQFMLSERMDTTDFTNKKSQELQADIVERYLSIILQLKKRIKTARSRRQLRPTAYRPRSSCA